MSASTEQLAEQIKLAETEISVAEAAGKDTSLLRASLRQLQRKLVSSNEALTEGKQILKG